MKQYYRLLDGLRAYAVLAVLISHFVFVPFIYRLGLGFVGVNLFFVLSGFLITEILINDVKENMGNKHILKKFYLRRTLRIFPIYYLACIGLALFNYEDAREVLTYNVFYITNIYNYITGNNTVGFSHVWSLCVEEQFYLFWPLLLLVSGKYLKQSILGLIAVGIGIRAVYFFLDLHNFDTFNYRMTPACLDVLGLGALLAYFKSYREEKVKKYLKNWWLPLLAAIVYIINGQKIANPFIDQVLNRLLVGVFSVSLIGWAVYEAKGMGFFLGSRILKYIGRISYGVYLYHAFVANIISKPLNAYLETADYSFFPILKYNLYLIKAPIFTIATIIVAIISFHFIEVPFLRLKKKVN